ncbi:hypothetical protein SAMN05421820_10580 [Pedobacter steynii]|uniref:Lipoprotein n=1 Tax=Pedobacter steynii TaxID=430522 RepID=A0A1G9W775_9SPHI|nr:hypothetical protein [Pedobacter steynii]NQX40197.1 hypothetical protein [Pedobacter steynii]SDM80163.1 hypothetical protein SAMN05421820_10580 [Pedobacter steynii]
MKRILYASCIVVALSACNSSPKQTQSVITPTPAGLPSASAPVAATGEKPTHNPAHGQPYHDCAIAVGAPLNAKNSAPVSPTPTPAPVTASPVKAPVVTPPTVPANQKEVRLNPAHGQPGHSCAIAVGAPLS